jgi:hypothetical protein
MFNITFAIGKIDRLIIKNAYTPMVASSPAGASEAKPSNEKTIKMKNT